MPPAPQTSTTNAGSASAPATTPAATPAPAPPPGLAYGVGEVLKMYQGGINKDVIVNYVNNTVLPFHMTADHIIYLQSLGVPQEITKAIIQRDGQLQQQAVQQQYYQQAAAAAAAQNGQGQTPPYQQYPPGSPSQVATPATPAPSVTYIGADSGYAYPYYDYGYPYYWPGVVVGGGWGWGWGWGGRYGWGGGYHGGFGGGHGGGFGGGHVGGGGGFGGGHGGGGHGR